MVGVGPPLGEDIVRAMMLIRLNTFAKGFSGVRPLLAETMLKMLNAGVTPYVPSKGSLGASGDLAPLAHIAAMSLIPDIHLHDRRFSRIHSRVFCVDLAARHLSSFRYDSDCVRQNTEGKSLQRPPFAALSTFSDKWILPS